jgi:hypothetical protein
MNAVYESVTRKEQLKISGGLSSVCPHSWHGSFREVPGQWQSLPVLYPGLLPRLSASVSELQVHSHPVAVLPEPL